MVARSNKRVFLHKVFDKDCCLMSFKKRKLQVDIGSQCNKKQKICKSKSSQIHNSSVTNSDEHQKKIIFDSIEECITTKQLNIPQTINNKIAEYAVGKIQCCANNECNKEILVLNNEQRRLFSCRYDDIALIVNELGYMHWKEPDDHYLCSKCFVKKELIIICNCKTAKYLYLPKQENCIKCDKMIVHCRQCNWRDFALRCEYCYKSVCHECENRVICRFEKCRLCHKMCCNDCMTYRHLKCGCDKFI